MPRGDGTGPAGFGPLTGRRAGYCAGYAVPGYANPHPGGRRGFAGGCGRGIGLGRGMAWRRGCYAPLYAGPIGTGREDRDLETRALRDHAKMLKDELSDIENRLKELKSSDGQDD